MYEKQTWIDGVSIANAERLNHIEDGIRKNSENINNVESNAYFIGYYSQDLKANPTLGTIISLNPDRIMSKNMTFENDILTIGEDGLYYVSGFIHISAGIRRSFFDVGITDGGSLSPTVIRSQDTQNMHYDKSNPGSGDPCYELNRPIFLKKGAKLKFTFWAEIECTILGNETFGTNSSNISVIKIGNYPEAM